MRGAFVIRLGGETNPADGHFEGSIEDVDSGKKLKFQSSIELPRFLGERFQAIFVQTQDNENRRPEPKAEGEPRAKEMTVQGVESPVRVDSVWHCKSFSEIHNRAQGANRRSNRLF